MSLHYLPPSQFPEKSKTLRIHTQAVRTMPYGSILTVLNRKVSSPKPSSPPTLDVVAVSDTDMSTSQAQKEIDEVWTL
jgi:hypothetical protein